MGKYNDDLKNAKDEFLDTTKKYKVIAASISFNDNWRNDNDDIFKLKPLYSNEEYESFLNFLDRKYDSGYGGQNLYGVIFCEDGVWMQRGEYDGSEWWDIYKYPDMRETFSEIEVLKYERNRKLKKLNYNSESSS